MKRRYKYPLYLLAFVVLCLGVLAAFISHNAPCGAAPALAAGTTTMQAVVYRCYGGPEVLTVDSIAKPVPADDELLIKVHAAAVNPLDWHYLRGEPYIMRMDVGIGAPAESRFGVDYSGTVEAVGKSVTRFKPGDEVFGGNTGAFAEYVSARETGSLAIRPASISNEQAAAMPIAAITALQALRDAGQLKAGQKVLINGASGGVGTFAVQIAKNMGAEVTGVCSTRNVELVASLGADHVVDYTQEDFMQGGVRYDLVIDAVGNRPLSEFRQVLTDKGIFVIVGGPNTGPWLGPLASPIKAALMAPFVSQDFKFFLAHLNAEDLGVLAKLMAAGKLKAVIDRTYPLGQTADAIRYVETGRTRGKVIVEVQ